MNRLSERAYIKLVLFLTVEDSLQLAAGSSIAASLQNLWLSDNTDLFYTYEPLDSHPCDKKQPSCLLIRRDDDPCGDPCIFLFCPEQYEEKTFQQRCSCLMK